MRFNAGGIWPLKLRKEARNFPKAVWRFWRGQKSPSSVGNGKINP
jgi:hypothetical protein